MVAVASGALLPGFLGGRGVCGFADPAGRIAGGEGFFGGFFDGVDRRVEIFGSCGAIGRSRVLIFCGIRHERNHSADGVGGAYRELWIWTADVKLWRTEMEGGVVSGVEERSGIPGRAV